VLPLVNRFHKRSWKGVKGSLEIERDKRWYCTGHQVKGGGVEALPKVVAKQERYALGPLRVTRHLQLATPAFLILDIPGPPLHASHIPTFPRSYASRQKRGQADSLPKEPKLQLVLRNVTRKWCPKLQFS
jgi:hypothetical protein